MTIKSIAVGVAKLLQADDMETVLSSNGKPENNPDVKTLIACINAAVADVAADGFAACKTETLDAEGGIIPLSAFARTPATVRRVTDGGGTVAFSYDDFGVAVPHDGKFTVRYTVNPEEAKLSSQAEVGALCDFEMLVYMSARNYCFATGRTDEAAVWDQLYEAHTARKRISRRASLPKRSWR